MKKMKKINEEFILSDFLSERKKKYEKSEKYKKMSEMLKNIDVDILITSLKESGETEENIKEIINSINK